MSAKFKKRKKNRIIRIGIVCIVCIAVVLFLFKSSIQKYIQKGATPSTFQTKVTRAQCTTSRATGSNASNEIRVSDLVNDGQTDNVQTIQNAINQAGDEGGGIVIIPKGTYIINYPLVMKNNVTLMGEGDQTILKAGSHFLDGPASQGYSIVTTAGASDVTIKQFTADHQGNVLDANSIDRFQGYVIHAYKSTNIIIDSVTVRNPFTYAIVAEESSDFCILNNNTRIGTSGKYDQLDGIHVLNSSYGDVVHNYVDQGYGKDGDDGLAVHTIDGISHDVRFANNKVRGGQGGAGMQLALTNEKDAIYNIVIQNNEFWGSPRGIRTGYYGGPNMGSVHDVIIGGSENKGNYIHDNIFNNENPGDVINIYGNGIDPYNITVSYNTSCKAGSIIVGKGANNKESNNKDCANANSGKE